MRVVTERVNTAIAVDHVLTGARDAGLTGFQKA